ncbi:hypothetical protein B0H66DRAFT_533511 [Apodospora peruviana]|uniref:Uncharacterized protein n=1 Tax=Apodospora peruviana TaxID=516989 RepID=A0AAE0M534_9PEZI|nr:hypothetical protein B0H66DRAFT_533511 [Apodospora peruviana]
MTVTVQTVGRRIRERAYGWGQGKYQYQRPFEKSPAGGHNWLEGEIAFLKPYDQFNQEDLETLIQPCEGKKYGYLPPKATGHPVIILRRLSETSTHVLVVPVSAYRSDASNNFLPPWKQRFHECKRPEDFRAFGTCERPNNQYPPLFLENNLQMPKPRASWVWVQSGWVVPLTVIGYFDKSNEILRMRANSLADLRAHMRAKCKRWKECEWKLEDHERVATGVGPTPPTEKANWRPNGQPQPKPTTTTTKSISWTQRAASPGGAAPTATSTWQTPAASCRQAHLTEASWRQSGGW